MRGVGVMRVQPPGGDQGGSVRSKCSACASIVRVRPPGARAVNRAQPMRVGREWCGCAQSNTMTFLQLLVSFFPSWLHHREHTALGLAIEHQTASKFRTRRTLRNCECYYRLDACRACGTHVDILLGPCGILAFRVINSRIMSLVCQVSETCPFRWLRCELFSRYVFLYYL